MPINRHNEKTDHDNAGHKNCYSENKWKHLLHVWTDSKTWWSNRNNRSLWRTFPRETGGIENAMSRSHYLGCVFNVVGGVAPRYQFTQADPTLRVSRAPIDFQQLSSGSVLGLITGYLTAKIGRLFLFSFGGIFLLAAVYLNHVNLSCSFFGIKDIFHLPGLC